MPGHLRKRQTRGRHRHRKYLYRRLAYIQAIAATLLTAGIAGSSLSLDSALDTNANAANFQQYQKTIQVNTAVTSRPYSFAASDGSNLTTFMPIWYIGQALQSLGIHQSWNGQTRTWTLSSQNGETTTSLPMGHGPASITVNGYVVRRIVYRVANDPSAGPHTQPTVYMPIYYVDEILKTVGFNTSWNGRTWHIWPAKPNLSTTSDGISASSPVVFGFVTDYSGSTASLSDLESHPLVRAFATPTFSITANGGVSGQVYAAAEQYAKNHQLDAYITISNYSSQHGNFDGNMTAKVLNSAADRTALIRHIVALVQNTTFQGVNIDFELMHPSSRGQFVEFLNSLSKQLHEVGKQLNVDVPGVTNNSSGYDYAGIGDAADDVIVMAYDYSYPGGPAGAIAPLWWVKKVTAYAVQKIPADHVILGIPTYGYDWHSGVTTALSLPDIDNLLATRQITPKWDSKDATPYFTYTVGSTLHTVYFENPASLTDKVNVAREYGLRGISLWRLGLENSAVWNVVSSYTSQQPQQ